MSDVSDHYRRKPRRLVSRGWRTIFEAVISNAGAVNSECERLLTAECAEMPFMMRKLAVDLKVCRKGANRGISSHPTPFSQTVADETELLKTLANEIERMPETVRELEREIA